MKICWSKIKASVGLVGLMTLVSCYDALVEKPFTKTTQTTNVRVAQNTKDKVDLLFIVDNSPSTKPKQDKLKANFKDLINVLDSFKDTIPANYHIGVVTSDMGLPVGGYTSGFCVARPGRNTGETTDPLKKTAAVSGGRLVKIGEAAAANCATVTNSLNFIEYNQKDNTNNIPGGAGALDTTFQCMASVGDKGCGIEAPLEAAFAALGGEKDVKEGNEGFLREDALLFVVFVTDEDDCSLDPSAPTTAALFDDPRYKKNPSYFCPRYGITCNGQRLTDDTPVSGLTNCQPIIGITESRFKQTEVQKYIDFFNKSKANGGVKNDPKDVYVVSLSSPSSGTLESIYADFFLPGTSTVVTRPYKSCTPPGMIQNGNNSCVMAINASCTLPSDDAFAGDPAVRLNYVVDHVANHQTSSICSESYQSALQNLGNLIITAIKPGCITSPFEDPTKPNCLAQYITRTATGNTTTLIPWCGNNHELVQGKTCWQLETKNTMGDPLNYCDPVYLPSDTGHMNPQQFGVKIDRVGDPPANTELAVACDTLPISGN